MVVISMLGFGRLDLVYEIYDGCDLLFLYCVDCDCIFCSDCVICDYVGYIFRKVLEVVEIEL